jgi:hypothetical protein
MQHYLSMAVADEDLWNKSGGVEAHLPVIV